MIQTPQTASASTGWWQPDGATPQVGDEALKRALLELAEPIQILEFDGRQAVASGGQASFGGSPPVDSGALPLIAYAPALLPEQLGDADFREAHGLKYACVAGAMANAIGSEEIVIAMSRAGMLGFFGAAGCSLDRIEAAAERLQAELGDAPYGFNLIHSPNEAGLEDAVVDLYLRRGVRLVSASAYLDMTPALVRYRVSGIRVGENGQVVAPNRVIAKVSRVELARKFFSPPPANMLANLVRSGAISDEQAKLAARVPLAEDLTAEADSGGHTDNRPALALLPTMLSLRDRMASEHHYDCCLKVGLAGGIATPAAAAAAFSMGAAFILTGSINQACVEAGTSDAVREMLAQAGQADVTMAPAADMFEMGVMVQVLKRGTMFAMRARKLYDAYRKYASLDEIPAAERNLLERDLFRQPLDEVWRDTRAFFERRDPAQVERAERDARHKMALVFRSYLGRASIWANSGEADRRIDYQVWCGPSMGAFNEWVRGSCLDPPAERRVATVALNLMVGAALLTRIGWLRNQAARLPAGIDRFEPMTLEQLAELLQN
ncbi:MAG: PfaD family polyunsaturated fatty acid/polyketide biosynthesis protein [Planctomycetes bacterium]|nr:PfaD family polyunsaturated fatty acid/polyketide biosynthesis protein [Planctomycetota bacterium]